jgi:hypothetical protein
MLHPAENDEVDYVRLLTGRGLDADLCCTACDVAHKDGTPVTLQVICEGCVALYNDDESGQFSGWRGEPGISERPEPVDPAIVVRPLPAGLGAVLDIAALPAAGGRSLWLVLTESGRLVRFDADAGTYDRAAKTKVRAEPSREGRHHQPRLRLHAARDGRFAAVVNDFGRSGKVIDLITGKATLTLDGGGYHEEFVPLSVAFAEHEGRTVVVHRTDWNRLDISDAATGRLLTAREPTSYKRGETEPEHYLGYFHGALSVSPDGRWLADEGWVWSPAGIPYLWDLSRWLGENVWESEDGPSRRRLCQRMGYWDVPMCWIGDNLLAISGLGDDDTDLLDGVRIFDADTGVEVHTFAGPQGALFGAGRRLYAAAPEGLEIWDPFTGDRTGRIPGFVPTHHHRGAGELAALRDGELARWRIG